MRPARAFRFSATLVLFGTLAAGCVAPGSGVRSGVEVLSADIYHSVAWSAQLPVKLVMPIAVRRVVKSYVADLELPDDVKRRVEERIESDEFSGSTVPFLYHLSQLYAANRETETFEQHVRARFADLRATPGFEHALFHWDAAPDEATTSDANIDEANAESAAGKKNLKAVVMAGIVRVYDAMFLVSGADPLRAQGRPTPAIIERATVIVRDLLREIAAQLPADEKLRDGLSHLAEDGERIEALTISLGDLIGDLAYGSFQRFARLAARREELRQWMRAELEKENYGRLEDYLRQAAKRRHAVLICVDGLQGHLVRALAGGSSKDAGAEDAGAEDADSRFLKAICEEASECDAAQPNGQLKKARSQSHNFLNHINGSCFRDERYLPFFRSLFAGYGHGIARCGVATTPTISVRNIPVVLTGAPVAGENCTGLPNFHFLDRREDRAWYFYGNDALELAHLTKRSGMKSLFTRLPELLSLSSSSLYDEGALVSLDPYITVVVGEKRRDWGESLLDTQLAARAATEKQLRELRARLLEVLALHRETSPVRFMARAAHYRRAEQLIDEIAELEDQGMPRYLQCYNPWPDHFAHPYGPFSDEILSPTGELNRLDFWLGRLDQLYRDAGIHSRTLFAIAGDHGLAPVGRLLSVDDAVFTALAQEGVKFRLRKLSADEGEPPVVTHPWRPPSMRGYDVVISSTAGGNCTLDFFVDQGIGWTRQPVAAELKSLTTLEGKTIDIIEETRRRLGDALDYLVIREAPCTVAASDVRLVATRGGKRVESLVTRRGDRIHYDLGDVLCNDLEDDLENDILEVTRLSPYAPEPRGHEQMRRQALLDRARAARREEPSSWLTEKEWRELCAFSPRPDAVTQIARLYDTDLAGTMNLFPAAGVAFNSLVPGRHAGESFHEKDAFVGFWGGGMRRKSPITTAVNGSLAPTVYEYLTGEKVTAGADGWGFPAVPMEE